MRLLDILSGINFGLVFFFGAALSVSVSGGCKSRRDWVLLSSLCPVFLALQALSWLVLGLDVTKQLYPLLIHLPLLLVLVFGLRRPLGISLVSICTAYLCCQLPRFGEIFVTAATGSPLAGETVYLAVLPPIFLFLRRYFAPSARDAMRQSPKSLLLFGGLPIIYYLFDYSTAVYSDYLYSGSRVVSETIPTVVGLLYMVYTTAYRQQLQRQTQTELINSLMASQLKQAGAEMTALRQADAQSAIYRHDMRHHLTVINAFLSEDKPRQAEEYIRQVQEDIEAITPKRFCENELVNLLCSSFSSKAQHMGVRLTLEVLLPRTLDISDTELCALLSNGLENALNAVGAMRENRRWVEFFCGIRDGRLLIEIKNPHAGQVSFRDGLPESDQPNHGNGCRSIQAIVRRSRGLCTFAAENGIFTLRIMLPMQGG